MTDGARARDLEKLTTGSPALDRILGGGIPSRSIVVVAGEPGSGKTILTLQVMFHLARQGRKSLFFTTLSEPALKLVRYMQMFSFFDERLLDEQIIFADLGSLIREKGPEEALFQAIERVEAEGADLVAIDSFRVLDDLLGDTVRNRTVKYDVAVRMAAWGATTLLVGEYQREDVGRRPEFAIGDGIILLTNTPQELTAVRGIEVLKLRGADYVGGGHFFDIGSDGLTFYPRVTASAPSPDGSVSMSERAPTGVPGLDELFVGGVPRSSATLLQGATGTGKTILSLQFLVKGARDGEPGVFFTLEETPGQLRAAAQELGWDLAALESDGGLVLNYASPVEMSTDRFLDQALRRVRAAGARRAVVDSLSAASLGVANERRFREMVHALTKHFRAAGVTLYMTMEVSELLGSAQLTGHGVSSTADNIMLLRYVEIQGRLERALSVLKARGLPHATELRHFAIGAGGGRVEARFLDMQGVLTGLPQPVAASGPPRRPPARRGRT